MRPPFAIIGRRRAERLVRAERALARERRLRLEAERAAYRSWTRAEDAVAETARLAGDLRLIRAQLNLDHDSTRVRVQLEFATDLLIDGYRRDSTMRGLVAAVVEQTMLADVRGRTLLLGRRGAPLVDIGKADAR